MLRINIFSGKPAKVTDGLPSQTNFGNQLTCTKHLHCPLKHLYIILTLRLLNYIQATHRPDCFQALATVTHFSALTFLGESHSLILNFNYFLFRGHYMLITIFRQTLRHVYDFTCYIRDLHAVLSPLITRPLVFFHTAM